jgi:YebC/PmpR family DNA-binding regulatory protein
VSGHSKWASIKRKKAKNDAVRGRLFSRLTREIIVAARDGGGDTDQNPRLRTAVENARAANLPNENIERAIKRGTGDLPGVSYEPAIYELYAAGGVAVLVETLTDNKNRTVSEIRHILSKAGGSLAETGSVAWQFDAKGTFVIESADVDEDELMMLVLEAGAEDMELEGDAYFITCSVDDFGSVKDALQEAEIPFRDAQISQVPKNYIQIDSADQGKVLRLLESIEEQDDVQNVYTNLDISEDILETAGEA